MIFGEASVGMSDEWYTPAYIFDALGESFDLDVASPGKNIVPWIPAKDCIQEDSLKKKWNGFIWMNPPFGKRNGLVPWLDKFCAHGHGICLVPDRTSAPWWQQYSSKMDAILFVSPKVRFISGDGKKNTSPAQGTCLMASGKRGTASLARASTKGLGLVLYQNWERK